MIRTQIQLPEQLLQRARQFASDREISVAEVARRGMELLLDRYQVIGRPGRTWALPVVDCGSTLVTLEDLGGMARQDEELRSLAKP